MILAHVFNELNRRKVRYLVAGGVAAVLYGNPRFTKDLDLWADLEVGNLTRLVEGFKTLRFIPRIPVKPEEFISAENRRKWEEEKGMKASTFINPKNPFENVDILLHVPISFARAYRRRKWFLFKKVRIPTVAETDLILMKEKAGRPQDVADINVLREIRERKGRSGSL